MEEKSNGSVSWWSATASSSQPPPMSWLLQFYVITTPRAIFNVFRLCTRHSILNISPYYLKADFIFLQNCDSKNSCPDTTRKGLRSLEDVDTTAGPQKKNIYFSLRLDHLYLTKQFTSNINILLATPCRILGFFTSTRAEVNFSLTLIDSVNAGRRPASVVLLRTYLRSQHRLGGQQELIATGVFFPNESTLIRARPQCKLPWRFTDVAC